MRLPLSLRLELSVVINIQSCRYTRHRNIRNRGQKLGCVHMTVTVQRGGLRKRGSLASASAMGLPSTEQGVAEVEAWTSSRGLRMLL